MAAKIRRSKRSRTHALTLCTAATAVFLGLGAPACSSSLGAAGGHGGDSQGGPGMENTGTIGLALQLPDGFSIESVSYQITGNGFTKSGSFDVSASQGISALIGGIPAGTGYTITLSAGEGGATCSGSAAFSVAASATTTVAVSLQCHTPATNGSVLVNGSTNVCPHVDGLTVGPLQTTVGNAISIAGSGSDADNAPSSLTYAWTATSGTIAAASSPSTTLTCTAPGTVTVTLTVSDGDCKDAASIAVTCSAADEAGAGDASVGDASVGSPLVRINEVESSGGVPGDWCELYNAGTATADISGWIFKDNDDTHSYTIPAGTTIAPGAFFVLEEADFVFGLGAPDATRIFDPQGNLVDSYSWTMHATTTYGRCPDGTGDFVTTETSTKGAPNACGGTTVVDAGTDAGNTGDGGAGASGDAGSDASSLEAAWPGGPTVTTVDVADTFGTNLSGLIYQPGSGITTDIMWGVRNGPSTVFQLVWNGTTWGPTTANGWMSGKNITYTDGTGAPDSEGITKSDLDASTVYVSTERDNNNGGVSRLSVLSYDTDAPGTTLTATHEWNLTADLPPAGANLGLEAITWIPDTYLLANGFIDQSTGNLYDPSVYPNHGTGIFLVGLEQNGMIYAYAFDLNGNGFTRLATIASGNISIMDLAFDREIQYLYADCDNTCGNKISLLQIETDPASPLRGTFQIRRIFDRPAGMGDFNNEGITFAPESECSGGLKAFYWADDDEDDGHALRQGTIPCGAYLTP
jgi:hypothetical protein